MRILTAEEMRQVDRLAIEEIGIPGVVLMENAALGVVEALVERFPEARRVALFCGPGNNGGDGLAVARHLDARGYEIFPFVVAVQGPLAGEAEAQREICRRLGVEISEIREESDLALAVRAASQCDVLVDALFGTGLSRPLEGLFARLVEELSELAVPSLAVDLPSGLNASLPQLIGPFLPAQCTVSFAALKMAQVFSPAADAGGELVVTDLGFPPSLVEEVPGQLYLTLAAELAAFLKARPRDSHKGSHGHLLLWAGSAGKSGAAVLAAQGAVRSGAGLVTAAVPAPLLNLVDGGSLESMTASLPSFEAGVTAAAAVTELEALAASKSALAVGPGLGTAEETLVAVRRFVLESPLPLVLDADGLNAFAGKAGSLQQRPGPTILTPHPGELARLLSVTTAEIAADRLSAVRAAARESGCVVVLKGHQSLVATPEGEIHVNSSGNAGMATGGTGDVLTGIIGALLAQGYEALAAAQLGVFLHGAAGDLVMGRQGMGIMAASDLLAQLPEAFRSLAAS